MAGKILTVPSYSLKEFRLLTGKTDLSCVMSNVSLKTRLCVDGKGFLYLDMPLISAAMQAVSGEEMAISLGKLGGLSVIPCSIPIDSQCRIVRQVKEADIFCAAAVSTQPKDKERIDALLDVKVDMLFIDASDGFSQFQADTLSYIKERSDIPVIGGNVITKEGFEFLAESGFDAVKVGMGIGSGCTTQEQKGTGRGQATALIEVCMARDEFFKKTGKYLPIISDGSISNAGQIMIALAIGADSVMMGRFFAQFTESSGKLIEHPKLGQVKEYWMEASARARSYGRYDANKDTFFEEGVEGFVKHIGSLDEHLPKTLLKIKSSMSSCGCKDIEELHKDAVLELQSPVALLDAGVHDMAKKE